MTEYEKKCLTCIHNYKTSEDVPRCNLMCENHDMYEPKATITDNEIIKAWQKILAMGDAPIGEHWSVGGVVTTKLAKKTLDMLNRQKAEIKGLNELVSLSIDTQNEFSNKIAEQEAEIECLENKLFTLENDFEKAENLNEALGNDVDIKLNHIYDLEEKVKKLNKSLDTIADQIKMEFYREFDELIPSIMADKIDEIVKECRSDE